jgi:hypothetical protein
MSVTQETLSAIQQAGQSIHEARQALSEAVTQQGQLVASAVVEQPFGAGNDKLFAQWKTLARLAQEVQSIEEQFKTIYETAAGLKVRDIQVLVALPHVPRQKGLARSHLVDDAAVNACTAGLAVESLSIASILNVRAVLVAVAFDHARFLWPLMRFTVGRSTPACTRCVMAVWRSVWRTTCLHPSPPPARSGEMACPD